MNTVTPVKGGLEGKDLRNFGKQILTRYSQAKDKKMK